MFDDDLVNGSNGRAANGQNGSNSQPQPHPQPRHLTFDTTTAAGLEGFKKSWNDWFDDRFNADLTIVMKRDGWLCQLLGNALARERKLMREHVRGELEALRRELAELRSEIKARRVA